VAAGLVAFLAATFFAGRSAFAQVQPEIDTGGSATVSVPPTVIHTDVQQASPFWVFALVVLIAVATTFAHPTTARSRPSDARRRLRSA
jgi:hypothetical protein